MREASKTHGKRDAEFRTRYMSGRIIDIGSGTDLVDPRAEPFDLDDGDANEILRFRPAESYDCVHSSHCLEHMRNPREALRQWWALTKPGGYLIVTVPHEDLYEQGIWPSIFNPDHKATFRLGGDTSWSPVSHDLLELARSLEGSTVISAEVHDDGYDPALRVEGAARAQIFAHRALRKLRRAGERLGVRPVGTGSAVNRMSRRLGVPVDQTLGNALAQIQIIVQKSPT